jgi:hypothetical protein
MAGVSEGEDAMMEHDDVERMAGDLDRWEGAGPVEREYELDAVGNHLMERYEAPAPPVLGEHFEDPRLLGEYDDADFRIEVNERLLESPDPREALETYLHEYRHAQQAYEVERSNSPLARDAERREAAEWEAEMDHYTPPERDELAYFDQPVERDAREFGHDWAERILNERRNQGGERR